MKAKRIDRTLPDWLSDEARSFLSDPPGVIEAVELGDPAFLDELRTALDEAQRGDPTFEPSAEMRSRNAVISGSETPRPLLAMISSEMDR